MNNENNHHYRILEGSPSIVEQQANELRTVGWECNGDLTVIKINDQIWAFQGMTNPNPTVH